MKSKTKIIILHRTHLLYILIGLILLFLILLFVCSNPQSTKTNATPTQQYHTPTYTAGKYCSYLSINGEPVEIWVSVDSNIVHHINMVHLSDTVKTSFPVFQSCFDEIVSQVIDSNSTQNITYSVENPYTSMALLSAIETALGKSIP